MNVADVMRVEGGSRQVRKSLAFERSLRVFATISLIAAIAAVFLIGMIVGGSRPVAKQAPTQTQLLTNYLAFLQQPASSAIAVPTCDPSQATCRAQFVPVRDATLAVSLRIPPAPACLATYDQKLRVVYSALLQFESDVILGNGTKFAADRLALTAAYPSSSEFTTARAACPR